MVTLLILGLAGTGALFAAVPVVAYALMLETCAERAASAEETLKLGSDSHERVLATAA